MEAEEAELPYGEVEPLDKVAWVKSDRTHPVLLNAVTMTLSLDSLSHDHEVVVVEVDENQ